MKKNDLFNSKTVLYTLAIFLINVLHMPDAFLLFDVFTFSFCENNNATFCVLITLMVLVISALSAVILQKLFSQKDKFLSACGIFLLADTLFRSTMYNFIHLFLLAISIALAIYLVQGEKFWQKNILTSVFVLVLPVISPSTAFCQVPIGLLAYSFALAKEKENAPATKNKKGNKQKTKNGIKETIWMFSLTALGIFLGFLFKDSVSVVTEKIDYNVDVRPYFLNDSFWVGLIPYIIFFTVFVWGYFAAKSKEQKRTVSDVIFKLDFLWLSVFSLGLVLYGLIFEKLSGSITIFNVFMVAAIILLYLHNAKGSRNFTDGILGFYYKHKYALLVVAIIWFFVAQFILKNVQFSLLDRMASMVGGTL